MRDAFRWSSVRINKPFCRIIRFLSQSVTSFSPWMLTSLKWKVTQRYAISFSIFFLLIFFLVAATPWHLCDENEMPLRSLNKRKRFLLWMAAHEKTTDAGRNSEFSLNIQTIFIDPAAVQVIDFRHDQRWFIHSHSKRNRNLTCIVLAMLRHRIKHTNGNEIAMFHFHKSSSQLLFIGKLSTTNCVRVFFFCFVVGITLHCYIISAIF